MARTEHLPIYKGSYDLYLEQVVQGFSRYHKYTLGTDLRDGARRALEAGGARQRAARPGGGAAGVARAARGVEGALRLGHDLKAFARFNAFEHATTQVVELAKQNEGWLKSQSQGHGRNRRAMPEGLAAPSAP